MSSNINWKNIATIPRTPFTKITVKDSDGDLYNVATDRHGIVNIPLTDGRSLTGWIPNDQL